MKATFNSILVYDDLCPLCEWYTKLFLKFNFISEAQKKSFSNLEPRLLNLLDVERACKEIPLINIKDNTVLYGIDSLLEILSQKIPFVKSIGNFAPLNWLLKKVYKLISYNRKGIVARVPQKFKFDCTPMYSFHYKKYFILFCFLVSTVTLLFAYMPLFNFTSLVVVNFVILIMVLISKHKLFLEYIMQYGLQLMVMAILLLPVVYLLKLPSIFVVGYIGLCSLLFFRQIKNRILYLKNLSF